MNLSVDVISDVICPWCFIGERRLEKCFVANHRIDPHVALTVRTHDREHYT